MYGKTLPSRIFAILIAALCSRAAFAQSMPLLQDAYVVSGSPTNYGSAGALNVGGPNPSAALVEFDLSTLPPGTTASAVSQATLTLFVHAVANTGTVIISVANGSWAEAAVDAGNSPVPGAVVASAVTVPAANAYLTLDATSAVKSWLSGTPNNGFIVTPASPGVFAQFDSKENTTTSHPAQLTIRLADVLTQSSLPGATASTLALGFGAAAIASGASGTASNSVAYGPGTCNLCTTAGGGYTDASADVAIGYGAGNSQTTGTALGAAHNSVAIGNQTKTYIALNNTSNCTPWSEAEGGEIAIGSGSSSGCRNTIVLGTNSSHTGADSGAIGSDIVGTSVDSWLFGQNVYDNGFAGIAMGNHASLTGYGQVVFGGDQHVLYGGITDLYIGPTQTNYMNGNATAMSVNPCGGGLGTFETGSGANQPGCSLSIDGGRGTGAAAGGALYFKTAPAGGIGSTQNALVTRMSISATGGFNFPGFRSGVAAFDANGNLSSASTLSIARYIETLHTPASSSEPCTAGTFTDDASYHYVCVSTNTWKRVALSSF